MRRRPPHVIALEADRNALQDLIHDGRIQQRIARRARVLLAMEDDTTVVQELAQQVAMTGSGIWRLCRRYEHEGMAMVEAALQSGRPRHFFPLGAGANRATGVL